MMGVALEREKLVDACHGCSIGRPDPNLRPTRSINRLIHDLAAARRHYCSAGHDSCVYLEGLGKVPRSEGRSDITHMLSDGSDGGRVGTVGAVEDDPSTIGKVLKHVRRGVLIHTHDGVATELHGREPGVRRACRVGFDPAARVARAESQYDGE